MADCYCCGAQCKDWGLTEFRNCCVRCADQVWILTAYNGKKGVENAFKYVNQFAIALDTLKAKYSTTWHSTSPVKKTNVKPPVCKRCREPAEFAEPSEDFMCYRCSH